MINNEKTDLLTFNRNGLEELLESWGYKRFHGRQLYAWIFRRGVSHFSGMTDLSKALREDLEKRCVIPLPEVVEDATGQSGASARKFLFRLEDGSLVETVLIPAEDRQTLCLSSQVGCAWKCRFCATGKLGLTRNMSTAEMIGTFLEVRNRIRPVSISNVVFMGMGEPLANLKPVMRTWELLTDPDGIAISKRKVTISTVGLPEKIRELATYDYPPKLVFSIGSPDEKIRRDLLPIAGKVSLDEMHSVLTEYAQHTRNRITIALLVAEGVNDSIEDARKLHRWLKYLPAKVNLLRYNDATPGFAPPDERKMEQVAAELARLGRTVVLRSSRGNDIAAACGQLAGKKVSELRKNQAD